MKNFMNKVKVPKVGKNVFDLTHDVKLSMDMGYLVPTLAMEVLPGDYIKLGCEALVRMAPMVAPPMQRINVTTHYFFVPNRICWSNWDDFITHKATPPGAPPTHPFTIIDPVGGGTSGYLPLHDYLGVPKPLAGQTDTLSVNVIPHYAYQRIWREYYADQTLQVNEVANIADSLLDGDNSANGGWLFTLRRRAWNRDYFTSCLPTPQHGVPVEVPLHPEDMKVVKNNVGGGSSVWSTSDGQATVDRVESEAGLDVDALYVDGDDIDSNLLVEDIRRASAVQRFFEMLMRTGRRLKEVIEGAFGVTPGDSRLQRPEYITGVKQAVSISEVLNTTGTEDAPQGTMAGHGVAAIQGSYKGYKAVEHGWIIGITSVQPVTAYQNGLWRPFFGGRTYLDYFWPHFANLGEEAVLNKEIFAYHGTQEETFGYLPRYSHYRTLPSRVCGDFRDTLDFWHLGRKFTTQPALNNTFIACDPGKRIFAVTDSTHSIWMHMNHQITAVRPVPMFGTPSLY